VCVCVYVCVEELLISPFTCRIFLLLFSQRTSTIYKESKVFAFLWAFHRFIIPMSREELLGRTNRLLWIVHSEFWLSGFPGTQIFYDVPRNPANIQS
jgi:hypothetical protein